jgi:hypothetical protein
VSFVPLRAGRYSIHVTLGDEPVGSGEPYFLRVEPGTSYAAFPEGSMVLVFIRSL